MQINYGNKYYDICSWHTNLVSDVINSGGFNDFAYGPLLTIYHLMMSGF